MNKNKRILLSLVLSLVLLIIFSVVYSKYIKLEEVQAYMLVEDVIKGEKLSLSKLKKVNISTSIDELDLVTIIGAEFYASSNLKKGQLLEADNVSKKEQSVSKDCEYISIPITTSDDALAYKIKKGSTVNIYFTGKVKQVSNVLNIKNEAAFSSNNDEAIVTTRLYENIEIAGAYDSVGSNDTVFNQIIIMVNKEDVAMLVNLKKLGSFTLSLIE